MGSRDIFLGILNIHVYCLVVLFVDIIWEFIIIIITITIIIIIIIIIIISYEDERVYLGTRCSFCRWT
jgi:hypothetical protein